MGTMMAPVVGSGSWPAWTASVEKPVLDVTLLALLGAFLRVPPGSWTQLLAPLEPRLPADERARSGTVEVPPAASDPHETGGLGHETLAGARVRRIFQPFRRVRCSHESHLRRSQG